MFEVGDCAERTAPWAIANFKASHREVLAFFGDV